LLAVQEANFIFSFTQAGLLGTTEVTTILLEGSLFKVHGGTTIRETWAMLGLAVIYCLYGLTISIFLYGRKTDYIDKRNLSI